MYGLGAADDQDLLYYKSEAAKQDEDLRRIKEYLLQNNDEEFVTQKLLPVLM
jgi:hypothetical protein